MDSSIEINGSIQKIKCKMHLPKPIGQKSTLPCASSKPKGVGNDYNIRYIAKVYCKNIKKQAMMM